MATLRRTPRSASARWMGTRLLYLVRHGQSTWNFERRIQGQVLFPPLTELGRRQARGAATRLAQVGATTLLTSDARRAWQTAEIIGSTIGLTPTATPRLREQHWGDLQGQMVDDPGAVAAGLKDEERFPGGESSCDVQARLEALLGSEVIGSASGPLVLVSHGNTIAQAVRLLSGGEAASPLPENGSVICVADKR